MGKNILIRPLDVKNEMNESKSDLINFSLFIKIDSPVLSAA